MQQPNPVDSAVIESAPQGDSEMECEANGSVPGSVASPAKPSVWSKLCPGSDTVEVITVFPGSDAWKHEQEVLVAVPAHFLRYNLRPRHFGRSVIYLNAADHAFYEQELPKPALKVWCVGRDDKVDGYVRRRLWEASYASNIQWINVATSKFELLATKDGLDDILYDGEKVDTPDIVLVRTGAAADYFALAVIRQLEKMGVTILNGCQSIEISRDKLQTMQVMASHGLPIAKTLLAKFPINLKVVEDNFEYPVIVKKSSGSQGKGIVLIESHEQLEDIADLLDPAGPLIFQEFLQHSKGRDLRVLVIGGRIIASMMRVASKGFKANVHQGGNVRSVKLSAQVEWLCLEATRLTGLDVAGIDLLIDKDTYKICEINSSPGFQGLEEASGVNVASATLSYIKLRMGLWRIPRRRAPDKKINLEVPVAEEHLS